MSKAIIIKGTYKKDGMTSALVENFIKGMKSADENVEIKTVDLLDAQVEFCRGCNSCMKTEGLIGTCVIEDDVREILGNMLDSDTLVFATPVYEMSPTALLKRFLERNYAVLKPGKGWPKGRPPKRKDKKGVIILSSGAPYPINLFFGITGHSVKIIKWICKLWGCGKVYSLKAGGMEDSEKARNKFLEKSFQLGRKIQKA
ncbi:flavodoxin family protein [candidate division WOR-3 bacterium]|nr:flavodoxin family protein [candidate division WOR-3 bacterium]